MTIMSGLAALLRGAVVSRTKVLAAALIALGLATLSGILTPEQAAVVREALEADPAAPVPPDVAVAQGEALEQLLGAGLSLGGAAVYTLRSAIGRVLQRIGG
jgi:drug/metabolite transporter (DMT)-like permease